jgi:hypothetical protein
LPRQRCQSPFGLEMRRSGGSATEANDRAPGAARGESSHRAPRGTAKSLRHQNSGIESWRRVSIAGHRPSHCGTGARPFRQCTARRAARARCRSSRKAATRQRLRRPRRSPPKKDRKKRAACALDRVGARVSASFLNRLARTRTYEGPSRVRGTVASSLLAGS